MSHPLSFAAFNEKIVDNPTTGEVVQWMCRLAWQGQSDMEVRRLAEDICRDIQSGDYASEAIAIYQWVRQNIRYTRDMKGVEFIRWPRETLRSRQGDCDDVSILIAALLLSVGADCAFVVASFVPSGTPSHVWCAVKTRFGYMVLDPVANVETPKMLKELTGFVVVPCDQGVDAADDSMAGMGSPPPGPGSWFSVATNDGWDYYQAVGTFPPTGRYRQPRGTAVNGFYPSEAFAAELPGDARLVGRGPFARGQVAVVRKGVLGSIFDAKYSLPATPVGWLKFGGLVFGLISIFRLIEGKPRR